MADPKQEEKQGVPLAPSAPLANPGITIGGPTVVTSSIADGGPGEGRAPANQAKPTLAPSEPGAQPDKQSDELLHRAPQPDEKKP